MHIFASAATRLVAIGFLANIANASPVAVDHRDVVVVSNQVLDNPTPTFEPTAVETVDRCCNPSCEWCHPIDTCAGNCEMYFFFIQCCSSEKTQNAVLVHDIDQIDWKAYLAKEVPTTISSPEAEIEHYKALAAADQASFDHSGSVPSKRDSAEVDDADRPWHCCTSGCGFCISQTCVKTECNRRTFSQCCNHKYTKNSIFVESADDIPWELLGDDWLGTAYETPQTVTEQSVPATKAVEAVSVASTFPDVPPVPLCCSATCGSCITQPCPPYNCSGDVLFNTCCEISPSLNPSVTIYNVSFASPLEEIEFHRSIMAGKPAPTISLEELRNRVSVRDVSPTMSIEYGSAIGKMTEPTHPPDGEDPGKGFCCQSGCTFCWANHKCFLDFGCNQKDKPQYNTCCVPRDGVVWVPDDEDLRLKLPPPPPESHV